MKAMEGFKPRELSQSGEIEKKRKDNKAFLQGITGKFVDEQLAHLAGTRRARYWIAGCVGFLLLVQHAFVYFLVIMAFNAGQLIQLEIFLGSLIAATLLETYKVVQIIVEWVFKERPHKPDCEL